MAAATAGLHFTEELIKEIKSVDFFCGNKSLDDLPEYLESKGIDVHKEIVYKTELEHHIVETDSFDAVIFLSPTAVYSFFKKNNSVFSRKRNKNYSRRCEYASIVRRQN